MKKIKVLSKNNNILHLEFPTRKEITMTMGRPQEFYESGHKHLRNKVFTQEVFLDTFTNDDGDVNYFNSWSGFNVPGNKMEEFFTHFDDWTKREFLLRRAISDNINPYKDYYVIATIAGDTPTIDHELVHAHYYLNKDYQRAVKKLIKQLDPVICDSITKTLKEMGYAGQVVTDEINAYITTSSKTYMKKRFGIRLTSAIQNPFIDLAREYKVL